MIKRILLISVIISLFGCASNTEVISEYRASLVPVDCLNRKNITDWLTRQAVVSQDKGLNPDAIKYKLWQVRSSCQSY
jgi:hypothetical protein